jgi:hypothetical protein
MKKISVSGMGIIIHAYKISAILVVFAVLPACNLINPDEPAPSYIAVDKFSFDPSPTFSEMGPSGSTKIRDVWVYIDNEFQGAYELPAHFPVLKTGYKKIVLSPGILLNGIASTRSPYPFYKSFIQETELTQNTTIHFNPVISYFESTTCAFCEDFEGSGFSLTETSASDTVMYQLPAGDPDVFEGNGSGVVYLDSSRSKFEISSTSSYTLPGAGSPVYLEVDYNINQVMQMGLLIELPTEVKQVPIINLNPTSGWNKIYVQLGYTVSAYSGSASGFKIYFGGIKDPSVANPVFLLDNIKVVHF